MPDSATAKAKNALGTVMDKLSLKDNKDRSPPSSTASPTSPSANKPSPDSASSDTPSTSDASSPTASSQASSVPSVAAVSVPDHPKQDHHPANAPPLAPGQEPAGFPTPSSSLFPPPDEGEGLTAKLDARIAEVKEGKKPAVVVDTHDNKARPSMPSGDPMSPAEAASSNWRNSFTSTTSATSSSPALPVRPSSRPPSRPPSVHRGGSAGSRASLESIKRSSAGSVNSITEVEEAGKEKAEKMTHEERGETNDDNAAPEEAAVAIKLDVVVRDFAFQRTDPRFDGVAMPGDDRRGSTMTDSSQAEDSPQVGSFGEGGGGSFSWGFVTSHLSSNGQSGSFGDFDEDEEDDPHQVPEVFVAGVYQAVYDFEPELETEMRMTTGDVVSVWERQCDGWVQAARMQGADLTGEIGLVPENYLTLLEAASPGALEHDDADSDWNGEDHHKHAQDRSHTPEGEPPAQGEGDKAEAESPVKVTSPMEMKEEERVDGAM